MLVCDVDGVLTDGGMYYSEYGDELKKFSTLDGGGFLLLRQMEIQTGWITGEDTEIVSRRAKKLNIEFLAQNKKDKMKALSELIHRNHMDKSEIAYIGDDINDLMVLRAVGVSGSVAGNFLPPDLEVDYVTARPGGSGAVREFSEWLLRQRGEYDQALFSYLRGITER